MVALLFSRVSGLFRDAIVAYQFGTTTATDSFVAAFTVPDLLSSLMLAGLVGVVAIPALLSAAAEGAEDWKLANEVLNTILVVATTLTVVGMILARPLVGILAPGLSSAAAQHAAHLMQVMLPALIFFAASAVFTAVLNGRDHFALPTLAAVFVNLAMIGAALLFARSLGVDALAWGLLAGSALQAAAQVPLLWRLGYRYHPRLGLHDPRLRGVYLAMLPLLLVILLQYGRLVVERGLGSGLGPGTIATLNFANRIVALTPALVVGPVSTVLYPLLNRRVIARQLDEALSLVVRGTRLVMVVAIPAALAMGFLAQPLVAAVYQRGVFDAAAAAATAQLVELFAVALVPFCINEFVTRTYFARRRPGFACWATLAGFAVTLLADVALSKTLGARGLAAGAGLGAWTVLAILMVEQRFWQHRELMLTALRAGIAAAVGVGIAVGTYQLLSAVTLLPRLGAALAVAVAAYLAALALVGRRDLLLVGRLSHFPGPTA